jgi:predicted ester cyclase
LARKPLPAQRRAAFEASAARPPAASARRHRFADIRDTRNPPTGKSVSYSEIFIMRFVDGRIAEVWGVADVFSQMKQLGVIPA